MKFPINQNPILNRLWAIFDDNQSALRLVGGCVRDQWLGILPHDLDLATPTPPEQVTIWAEQAGFHVIPTGLAHGTVTVRDGEFSAEITTLRRDITTDGRHATIAFTDDWQEDAKRRDFTINALSMDQNGIIYDYLGGLDDLAARRVRFIGDPAQRIAEDRLRILRFFRFQARFGDEIDPVALAACYAARMGLRDLSIERVRDEFLRLLAGPQPTAMLRLMQDHGILSILSPFLGNALNNFDRLDRLLPEIVDPHWRLRALLPDDRKILGDFADEWRLPGAVRRDWLLVEKISTTDPNQFTHQVYHHGVFHGRMALMLGDINLDSYLWVILNQTGAERMPIDGKDVMTVTSLSGPIIGEKLAIIEKYWLSCFPRPDRDACLAFLQRLKNNP